MSLPYPEGLAASANDSIQKSGQKIVALLGGDGLNLGGGGGSITPPESASDETVATMTMLVKTVASSATPERISATDLFVKQFTVLGKKAARTNNTGIIWIGTEATNDTQPYMIPQGSEAVFVAPDGKWWNLRDFWVDVATNADGVVVLYSV